MITLSRRGFLQLSLTAIVAAAAKPLDTFVAKTSVPRRLLLYDILAVALGDETGFLEFARPNGCTLLQFGIGPGSILRWTCWHGEELVIPVGEGLLNQSTCPIDLRLHVTDGQDSWIVDQTGRALGMEKHTPALYTRLWVPRADGRYKLEAA